jgi:hypothetical protein
METVVHYYMDFADAALYINRFNNKEESSQFNLSYASVDNFSLPKFGASDNVSSVLIPHNDVNSVL